MKGLREGTHTVHPDLERFQAADKRKGMKVVIEGLPVDFLRGRLDSLKDIRGFPKMDPVGQIIFMSPAGEAHIDLYKVERQIRSDQKVNSEIHGSHTKKQVLDYADLSS